MIAVIYPDGHPGLNGKKHPVRYFDIRKLTPTECFRLMGVQDGDIRLIDGSGISNSAKYKLAGNSIVEDCLYYIYRQIWAAEPEPSNGSLFPEPTFAPQVPAKINMVTLCSGYDSQCLAMRRFCDWYNEQHDSSIDFELKAWSEFDPESKAALDNQPAVVAHNALFPQWADRNLGDMTKADYSKIEGDIDLLTYSTPCQSISNSGKRAGMTKGSGTRSAILWYTENAIRTLRPKFLLQENVKAITNKVNMPDFVEWQRVCEDCGYDNYWTVMNAKDYGVPQNRERMFMLSVRSDLGLPAYKFPKPFKLGKAIADILEEDVDERFFLKPESVIKFFQKNEKFGNDLVYVVTSHKLSAAEIKAARDNERTYSPRPNTE